MSSGIEALAEISRYYGANPDYVIAGGGNTSFKDKDTLFVKASGQSLADAVPEAFVRMDRKALGRVWEKTYPEESGTREKEVLADLLAARKAGEEQKRPSVETMIHDLLPFNFVVHTHPALVNGLTCSARGAAAMEEIFAGQAIWIPSSNPGYVLSLKVKNALVEYSAKCGRPASVIFLQNHGVFVGADSVEEIKEIYAEIISRVEKKIQRQPDFGADTRQPPKGPGQCHITVMSEIANASMAFLCNNEIAKLVKDRSSFYPVSSAFTPDHIVYAGSDPLFTEAESEIGGREAFKCHAEKTGRPPKIIAVRGLGVFGLGPTEKAAALALELFADAVKVAVYSLSFGGPRFMGRDEIDFINNWEVEAFRAKVSGN